MLVKRLGAQLKMLLSDDKLTYLQGLQSLDTDSQKPPDGTQFDDQPGSSPACVM
jgi:hypothetical protein